MSSLKQRQTLRQTLRQVVDSPSDSQYYYDKKQNRLLGGSPPSYIRKQKEMYDYMSDDHTYNENPNPISGADKYAFSRDDTAKHIRDQLAAYEGDALLQSPSDPSDPYKSRYHLPSTQTSATGGPSFNGLSFKDMNPITLATLQTGVTPLPRTYANQELNSSMSGSSVSIPLQNARRELQNAIRSLQELRGKPQSHANRRRSLLARKKKKTKHRAPMKKKRTIRKTVRSVRHKAPKKTVAQLKASVRRQGLHPRKWTRANLQRLLRQHNQ
jgi:hypothetical protein